MLRSCRYVATTSAVCRSGLLQLLLQRLCLHNYKMAAAIMTTKPKCCHFYYFIISALLCCQHGLQLSALWQRSVGCRNLWASMELQSLQLDFHSVNIASLVIILLLLYMLLEMFECVCILPSAPNL